MLDLSEVLRLTGYFDPEIAVLQAVCLDRLGDPDRASARLDELVEVFGIQIEPFVALGRTYVGRGKHSLQSQQNLRCAAERFLPRLGPSRSTA